jgi:hypothetical protein
MNSVLGRMVSRLTYGEQIWNEMGEGLSHWNLEALTLISQAFFGPWLVEFFPFCGLYVIYISQLRS